MPCPLCVREQKTQWIYEDEFISIFYCETCGVPLVVLNRHTMSPTPEELIYMKKKAEYWGKEIYGEGRFYIDRKQRKIQNHLHWHIRLKRG